MDRWAHLADFRAFSGRFQGFFVGGVMHCYTVSCVVFVLLFLSDGYANYQPFLFLCVNFLWVMQAFFCDK